MSIPEPTANFYGPNVMQNNHTNMFNMYMPYQNLPNGQYTQNQFEPPTRYMNLNQQPLNTRLEAPTKPTTFEQDTPVTLRSDNDSNSSSSDSDDSNNDSDSSSDSDAEKDNKENQSKMVVKPFRLNLNATKVRIIEKKMEFFA